jgi:hypothetical protein
MHDLIEAGLSEAAGWRAGLWGLCRRRLIREVVLADPGVGHQGSTMVIGWDRGGQCCIVALSMLGMAGGPVPFDTDFAP